MQGLWWTKWHGESFWHSTVINVNHQSTNSLLVHCVIGQCSRNTISTLVRSWDLICDPVFGWTKSEEETNSE
jgi:hypothetical protein